MLEFLLIMIFGELFWIGWDLGKICRAIQPDSFERRIDEMAIRLDTIRDELWKLRHHQRDMGV